jgi:hypothetical protein
MDHPKTGRKKYIAGYVKHKLTKKFPNAKDPFPTINPEGTWILHKSHGGLQYPSIVLVNAFKKWGTIFDSFHGHEIFRGYNPIEKLVDIILNLEQTKSEVDKYIIFQFVSVRFFQRIKLLNKRIRANERKVRLK